MNNVTRYELEIHEGGGEVVTSETGGFVDYDDYLSQLQQTDALQTSLNNIINAFGISGEGAHSKLVIEYVHGLVAENAKIAEEVMSYARECDRITYYKDNKITDAHQTDAAKDIEAASINTDGAIAEIKASELDDLARSIMEYAPVIESDEYHVYEVIAKDVTDRAANLRAGRKG